MDFQFSYQDMVSQCNTLAYLNVVSFCMLSGCGTIELPHEAELDKIYKIFEGAQKDRMPKNIFFMPSLYKKCLPIYDRIPDTPFDFSKFVWTRKNVKKVILPQVLSYSISSMTRLVRKILNDEIVLDNKDFVVFCLINNSIKQADFMRQFLKFGELYYSGEDAGSNSYEECNIELNTLKPDLLSQFLAAEAMSAVLGLPDAFDIRSSSDADSFEKELDILPLICGSTVEGINSIISRELAQIGLSLIEIYQHPGAHRELVYNTLNTIGCEVCERLYDSGDICRSIEDSGSSSIVTLCNCLNLLSRLYAINPVELYSDACLRIYDRIDSYWNESLGLFVTSKGNKMKYTIKDSACVLSALRAFRDTLRDSDLFMYVERQLCAFYRSAFINSKIFNSQMYPILQHGKIELYKLGSQERDIAPIFSKGFEVKVNKRKYYCEADTFYSEYVLYACKYLL